MGKKLLDIMREKIRVKHYSIKTENIYIYWEKNIFYFIINDILILWKKKRLKNI